MKLLTYLYNGTEAVGFLNDAKDGIHPIIEYPDMNRLIAAGPDLEALLAAAKARPLIPGGDVRLEAPIPEPRQDVICLGLNYRAHAAEVGEAPAEDAVYFSKRAGRCTPPDAAIDGHFDLVRDLDYEVELAVVIGRDCSRVSAAEAMDYVFGYTILNDISARTLQMKHKQWYFGKSLDGFTVMGPWIVTRDEFGDCPDRKITLWVNKEMRQKSRTGLMIHTVAEVIAELSAGMTLKAGTIIATGTPDGVAMGRKDGGYLQSGDEVLCWIEGIGYLSNTVK